MIRDLNVIPLLPSGLQRVHFPHFFCCFPYRVLRVPGLPSLLRPTIGALHERGERILEHVLEENAGRWESASARDLARVEALARAVVARLLHEPTIRLRSLDPERVHGSIEMLRDLFALRGDAATQVDEEGAGNRAAPARAEAHDNVRELRSGKP